MLAYRAGRVQFKCNYQSNLSLYALYYTEACNELARHISASFRPGNTAPFEEMLHRWPAVDYAVPDLTGPRFEPQTFRYTYEVTNVLSLGQLAGTKSKLTFLTLEK